MKRLKYGIIGLGFFGEKHAETLSGMPEVELAAFSTRRPDRLNSLADKFNVPKRYPDYRDLLNDPEIEAVSIVTHVDQHAEMAVAALNAGKHVFLEKPMADSVESGKRIVEAAGRAQGKFMTGHICRFDARMSEVKKIVDAGRIGNIVSIHATRNLPVNIGAEVLDKISPIAGDGVHDTDLMLWLTRSRISSVFAVSRNIHRHKNPDLGWVMYEFESGAVGVLESIWMLPENTPFKIDARMEIIGTAGAVYVNAGNGGVQVNDRSGFSRPDTMYWPEVHGRRLGALYTELAYFVNCVRNDLPLAVITPDESLAAVAAVTAAEKSCATGNKILL
ncbi:MAG: Gfo/Idh/MocA family oxidoreductase [Victivallaceae bacterium]|nr:Gfo/Idh/MocA family oxidoreductase [Victivallaceae bacterium]